MTDVSGIPNMGFGGGGYFGGIPNQQPAMSADQINASMWGRYSPAQAQSTLNNIYGAGGFGAQPAYYAGLGAAYGRSTGGFGGAPGRVGTISNPTYKPPAAVPMPQARPFGLGASAFPYAQSANYFSAYPSARTGSSALPSTGYPTAAPRTTGFGGAGGYTGYNGANPFTAYQSSGYNPFAASTFNRAVQGNTGTGAGSYTLPKIYVNAPSPSTPLSSRFNSAFSQLGAQARANPLAHLYAGGAVANPFNLNARSTPYQMPSFQMPGAGGTDFGGRARAAAPLVNPLNRVDWAQSYGNRDPGTLAALSRYGAGLTAATPAQRMGSFPTPVGWAAGALQNAGLASMANRGVAATPAQRMGSFAAVPNQAAMAAALLRQGNALNMPSGAFGGHPASTYGAPSSGYIGRSGIYADPFGGFVPQQRGFTPTYLRGG